MMQKFQIKRKHRERQTTANQDKKLEGSLSKRKLRNGTGFKRFSEKRRKEIKKIKINKNVEAKHFFFASLSTKLNEQNMSAD